MKLPGLRGIDGPVFIARMVGRTTGPGETCSFFVAMGFTSASIVSLSGSGVATVPVPHTREI